MTNDEAKVQLDKVHTLCSNNGCSDAIMQALDLALWLLERESEVAKVRNAGEAHSRSIDVWVQGLIDWEREHPKPGS